MHKENKIYKRYGTLSDTQKSVIWYTLTSIIQNGILFLTTPIYTRILTDTQYGIFSVYQSWQHIVSIIAILAMDRCVTIGFIKYPDQRKEFLSSVQTLMTVSAAVFCVLVCLCMSRVQQIMGLPPYIIAIMFPVALFNNSLANWSWLQRYEYHYVKLTVVTIFSTIIMQFIAVAAITFMHSGNKGEILILSMSAARFVLYGVIYFGVFEKGRCIFKKEYWKFALRYSVPVIPHALTQIVLNSSDKIMIDKICGREEAAYYGVTYSAAMVLNIVITSVSSAVQPWFFEKIKKENFDSIKKTSNSLLLFFACLSVSTSLFAPEVLSILAPKSYRAALGVFPAVAASAFFNSLYLCFANFESYYEKPYYFSIATSTGAATNIILNFILLPRYGFIVAGYTTLICYMIFALMHYLFMRKVCSEKLGGKRIFDLSYIVRLSAVVMFLALGMDRLYDFPIIRYFLLALVIGCVVIILRYKYKRGLI